MNPCEAEERNMRALYEIELMWGSGLMDLGKLKRILTGRDTQPCDHQTVESVPMSIKIGA